VDILFKNDHFVFSYRVGGILSGNNFTPVKKPYFTGLLPIVYAFWQQNGNII